MTAPIKQPWKRQSKEHYAHIVQIRIRNYRRSFWDRFWKRVVKSENGCWRWTASKKPSGYGKMVRNGKLDTAHRISWIFYNGKIPKNMWVLHKCDNPECTNPDHLYLGTHADNTRDAVVRKRFKSGNDHWGKTGMIGSENPNAVFTDNQVRRIRNMYRRGVFGFQRIANKFGADKGTIAHIIRRETWRHVK